MSYSEWLQRKVDEHTHNETLAFMLMILGMNMLIGGLVIVVIQAGSLTFSTLQLQLTQSFPIGLILAIVGISMLTAGFVLLIYYDRKKSWYLKQIKESAVYEKEKSKT